MFKRLIKKNKLEHYLFDLKNLPKEGQSCHHFIFRSLNELDFQTNSIFHEKDRLTRYLNHQKNGHICYGFVTPENRVAAYFWLSIGIDNPAFKHFFWTVAKDEAYIWDCRTVPSFQQQGLYREGLRLLAWKCYKRGIKKIMISCEPNNRISHFGIISAGFKYQGTTTAITTHVFKIILNSKKKFHVSKLKKKITTREVIS